MNKYDVVILVPIFNPIASIEDIKPKLNSQDELTKVLLENMKGEVHGTFYKDLEYFKIDETNYDIDEINVPCDVYLFFDKQSCIGTVQFYLKQIDVDPTRIAHLIDNNLVRVTDNGEYLDYEEYVNKFGLEVYGDCRCLFNMTPDTNVNILKAIITGGTNHRMNMTQAEYDTIKLEKIDIFKDWPIYAGRRDVIQLNNSSSLLENYNDWIIYQTSIAMMQYTAVYKANRSIEKELMYKHSIDEQKSLKIIEEFGLCNNLYSCNMFSHTRSKQLAEKLRDIFDTDERFQLYKDNKEILFDIAELRDNVADRKTEKWMFIIVMVVNISSVLDLIADWLEAGTTKNSILGVGCSLTILWILYMIWRIKRKK